MEMYQDSACWENIISYGISVNTFFAFRPIFILLATENTENSAGGLEDWRIGVLED